VEVIKGKLQTASREFTIYPGNAGESASWIIILKRVLHEQCDSADKITWLKVDFNIGYLWTRLWTFGESERFKISVLNTGSSKLVVKE
jgi:hypothetical protein